MADRVDIQALEDRARDLTLSLPDDLNSLSPLGEEVSRPAGREFDMPYALDGSDPNIPLLSDVDLRNVDARMFVTALDQHIVEATRLDSRFATYRVTPRESLMLHSSLAELFDICISFGGDEKRIPIPHGVRPNEEPRGAIASPNRESRATVGV